MPPTPTQPLSLIAQVNIDIAAPGGVAPTFNQGLVIGTSAVIPSVGGSSPRIRKYPAASFPAACLADGFSLSDPEVIALGLYFSQVGPAAIGWIGRRDLTAIQAATIAAGNAGLGYVPGDVIGVTQGGALAGFLEVLTVGPGGAVATLGTLIGLQGTGYSVANGLVTTGGSGNGALEVDITAIGESCVEAVAACRIAQPAWYGVMVIGAAAADHLAVTAYGQTAMPPILYHGATSDAAVLSGAPGNILSELKAAAYNRACMIYSTLQNLVTAINLVGSTTNTSETVGVSSVNGLAIGFPISGAGIPGGATITAIGSSTITISAAATATAAGVAMVVTSTVAENPNAPYAAAAVMGVAMGLNTGLAGSYFTMKFKQLVGVVTEPLSLTQISVIEGNNGNLYIAYPGYNFFEQGVMPNGQFYDEVIFLDVLGSNISVNVVKAFADALAIPLNNGGEQVIITAVNQAAGALGTIGFISPGTWGGVNVLGLAPGTALPTGYQAQAQSFSQQAASDRAARKMMPVYLAIIEGQAGHSALIGVFVQR